MKNAGGADRESTGMSASHSYPHGQIFGYVQSNRLVKLGKRTLIYREPGSRRKLAVSKPLVAFIALLLGAMATGYFNGGVVSDERERHMLPTSVPVIPLHRLVVIGADHDHAILSVNPLREV